MKLAPVRDYLQPRLRTEPQEFGGTRLVNTTGDITDQSDTAIVPKAEAVFSHGADGQSSIQVHHRGQELLIPKEFFRESPGDNGVYYLPTFRNNFESALVSGAIRGMLAAGPIGALAGVGGAAAMKVVGNQPGAGPWKTLACSGVVGSSVAVASQALFQGNNGLGLAGFVGGVSGLGAALAGAGEAKTRDSLYGGAVAGLAASLMTGAPMVGVLTAGTVSGLAAQANSKSAQMVTGAVLGAGFGAVQALLTGSSVGLSAALGAGCGLIGPMLGQAVAQVGRNLGEDASQPIRKALRHCSERQLVLMSAIPSAVSYGLLGSAAGLVNPALVVPAVVIGATLGGVSGVHQAQQRVDFLKSQESSENSKGVRVS